MTAFARHMPQTFDWDKAREVGEGGEGLWCKKGGGDERTSGVHFAGTASLPGPVHASAGQNGHLQNGVCPFSCITHTAH